MFDHAIKYAREFIGERGGLPVTFIGYSADSIYVVPCDYQNDNEKYNLLKLISLFFSVHNVESYVVMHEIWMSEDTDHRTAGIVFIKIDREKRQMRLFRKEGFTELEHRTTDVKGAFTEILAPANLQITDELRATVISILDKLGMQKLPLS
jgi:hypothetical protein